MFIVGRRGKKREEWLAYCSSSIPRAASRCRQPAPAASRYLLE
jgi:hypothetical protein